MPVHRWSDLKRRVFSEERIEAIRAAAIEEVRRLEEIRARAWPGGWQGAQLVIWHGGSWLLTWHAPWCRDIDCKQRGLRSVLHFECSEGYVAGLGFELSYA